MRARSRCRACLAACLVLSLCCASAAVESQSEWDEDLEEFFHKVDRNRDGQIEAQEAAQYIGDNEISQDEDLAQAIEQVCTLLHHAPPHHSSLHFFLLKETRLTWYERCFCKLC